MNCTRRSLWDRLFGQGFDSPHLHQMMVIRTLRLNRGLQSGGFVCIVISDFKRITTTHDHHADECREKYSPILARFFGLYRWICKFCCFSRKSTIVDHLNPLCLQVYCLRHMHLSDLFQYFPVHNKSACRLLKIHGH